MASPAPFTKHPMFPSKATYDNPAAIAFSSWGSTSSEATEFFLNSTNSFYLNLALSSIFIFASTQNIKFFGSVAQGLIST